MNWQIIGFLIAGALGAIIAYLKSMASLDSPDVVAVVQPPPKPIEDTPLPAELLWDTPKHSFHAVRVLCDELGLTYEQKNILCACVYQESRFSNAAIGRNKGSTDWGIVQVNDYYHIGQGKDFPSVEFVINNPEKCVRWMIQLYKHGKLNLWSSYKSGAYQQWLKPTSPMWEWKTI